MTSDPTKTSSEQITNTDDKLKPGFSPISTLAFSIGTAIGWGSLVVTCNTYLAQAGVWGTIIGLIIGMLVILVITRNLRYMILRNQSAGGIYSFARKTCGNDYGFLAAWFLLITYMSILWANITSVPLFVRYFAGDVFRFGFRYKIFGYEVCFGEVLLSMTAIGITGLLCVYFRRVIHIVMVVAALLFVVGFTFCTVWALCAHGSAYSYDPAFLPDSSAFSQISKIAVISPWAFIGFESVSHSVAEYTLFT